MACRVRTKRLVALRYRCALEMHFFRISHTIVGNEWCSWAAGRPLFLRTSKILLLQAEVTVVIVLNTEQ